MNPDTEPGTTSINAKGLTAGRDNIVVSGDYVAAREEHSRTFTIPSPPRDFTGRTKEIDDLIKLLTESKRAVISGLTGMGGVGKSTLASFVAQKVASIFPDAALWIDMQGMADTPLAPTDAMRQVILAFSPAADL